MASELAGSDLQVRAVVRDGRPADEILEEVRARDAGLVVMRTHGRAGIERAVLGSTAQEVLAAGRVPVVLVRPGGGGWTTSELCSYRLTGHRAAPLGWVLPSDWRRRRVPPCACSKWLFRFRRTSMGAWSGVAASTVDPAWDEEGLAASKAYLEGIRARLASRVADVKTEALISPSVADAIVRRATEQSADMIVMSSQALTGLARALLGSVADAVVRTADCPVLVVHITDQAEQARGTPEPAASARTQPQSGDHSGARAPAAGS